MFTLFFTTEPVIDFTSAKTSDTAAFSTFFNSMLEQGIYLPPSQFEACFISSAHNEQDIADTLNAVEIALDAAYSNKRGE